MDGFYGTQSTRTWGIGETDARVLVDTSQNEYLWRITAHGTSNVRLQLTWGSGSTQVLGAILLPFEAYVPGQAQLSATKQDDGAGSCTVTLTTSCAYGDQAVRTFVTAVSVLPTSAKRFTALAAATLTIAGVAGIAVAAGATIPLVHPASVTAGSGILEHTV